MWPHNIMKLDVETIFIEEALLKKHKLTEEMKTKFVIYKVNFDYLVEELKNSMKETNIIIVSHC